MRNSVFLYLIMRMKKSKKLLFVASWIYTSFFSPTIIFRKSGITIKGAFLRRVKIKVSGNNNQVFVGPKVMMNDSVILVSGDNCKVYIEGGGTNIHHCHIEVRHTDSEIIIKKGFTSEQVSLHTLEGRKIEIGEDCMFSADIYITTSDFHAVIDVNTGMRINPAQDVIIGNHVWLGHGASVLKGALIADNSIVGKDSTVVGKLEQPNSIYVGSPARKVKDGITWKREI